MTTIKREIFKRPTRMVHRFDENASTSNADPIMGPGETFDARFPLPGRERRSPPLSAQTHGQHEMFNPNRSPIQKPAGRAADFNGPEPDYAEQIAAPIHPSTKKRVGHLKTDK
jgi:hypothetical protein